MMRVVGLVGRATMVLGMMGGAAKLGAQDIIARDGYEAFPWVEYVGGDARFPKKGIGVLVLTDSTLGFYNCRRTSCADTKAGPFNAEKGPIWLVRLTRITEVSSSTQNRGPSVPGRILFGTLATDSNVDYFGFTHETDSSAEAPVFKTLTAVAGALEAKVRYRMKKAGIALPSPPPP